MYSARVLSKLKMSAPNADQKVPNVARPCDARVDLRQSVGNLGICLRQCACAARSLPVRQRIRVTNGQPYRTH
jgi:hypothetical protein